MGESEDRAISEAPADRQAQAKSMVDEALASLPAPSAAEGAGEIDVEPDAVREALEAASEALAGPSECRQAEPFADIIMIGDGKGLRWECTHNPPHRY